MTLFSCQGEAPDTQFIESFMENSPHEAVRSAIKREKEFPAYARQT
jgi:hypothetical protein